jgi:4'-phosphopantetheinyl transferase EntD
VIEDILPPVVAAVELRHDPPGVLLYPEEEAAVARAVEKRRREFATVRHCAREALARLGLPPAPIVPGPRGAPRWPDGVVGSMTHCAGYRAAAVGLARDVATIGIDAEPHEPLPEGVIDLVASPAERRRLTRLAAAAPDRHWDRVLFCAKEAVYKAWSPLTGRWLDFGEVDLILDPDASTFTARLLVPGPVVDGRARSSLPGRFRTGPGVLLAAVAWPTGRPG